MHRLDISLQDVANLTGKTMAQIYTDVKRGKIRKDSLESVIDYVQDNRKAEDRKPAEIFTL